ncbi:hypothetical protein CMQ_4663 [Grosmannia clavigera kw1407]|uniref:DUF676 domain-containing protein n=1 Tax=Grosmannia clavigera (strain kw1407 / UAMH 11150) TaxID=655863 RepID=F0XUA3_GROCL|nr:uncharacterized protein CMQ_4663 [Grosmannia clavigera kw1407]EFW98811.1 hypothetical protein CMQ_4663 [Grosmannia clavigera kw1407]
MTTPTAGAYGRQGHQPRHSGSYGTSEGAAASRGRTRHTLLLCFVHGFKGDADTFGPRSRFAHELGRRVAVSLPRVDVRVAVYPPYQTRGDLAATVVRLRDWLTETVVDLEVAAGTPSPTVEPSVRCVLMGHSMGGIVSADVLLSLVGDRRVGDSDTDNTDKELNGLMFPYVQAVLGFDTPYLGIAPGVVAHGAQDRYAATTAAFSQISSLAEALLGKAGGAGGGEQQGGEQARAGITRTESGTGTGTGTESGPRTARMARSATAPSTSTTSTPSSAWGWGRIALVAGASALASGAAAAVAYRNRDHLTEGWSWVSSHLEFVGCLARGEDLRRRIARIQQAHRQLGVGFGNLYTRLGRAAPSKQTQTATGANDLLLLPSERTFCVLPSREPAGDWREAVNDDATDETRAHMSMFTPAGNPNYDRLLADACDMVSLWTRGSQCLCLEPTQNLAPLGQHVRVQDVGPRHIHGQHGVERGRVQRVQSGGRAGRGGSQVDEPHLGADADRIQHQERAVAQGREPGRRRPFGPARETEGKNGLDVVSAGNGYTMAHTSSSRLATCMAVVNRGARTMPARLSAIVIEIGIIVAGAPIPSTECTTSSRAMVCVQRRKSSTTIGTKAGPRRPATMAVRPSTVVHRMAEMKL